MNQALAVWLLLALALVAANLPFLTERVLAVATWKQQGRPAVKPLWVRMAEILLLYVVIGAVGFAFEGNLGNRFRQGWEFYAITLCLFLVMAYPGFVYRYLFRKRKA
ncbi:MAG: DUF2818 family protein [Corticimicrobacter sp.]|uniref:DUF2818 family protein n=1 Tax=Corticimicrobacter sp. TaxID=2678536 RepID=UPI0032DADB16